MPLPLFLSVKGDTAEADRSTRAEAMHAQPPGPGTSEQTLQLPYAVNGQPQCSALKPIVLTVRQERPRRSPPPNMRRTTA